jgi:hypothetical protein
LRERRVDLRGEAAGHPRLLVDVVGVHPGRDDAEEPDDEEQEGHKEQEEPQGDGCANDRARRLAVTAVEPQSEVHQRPIPIPLAELVHSSLPGADAGPPPRHQPAHV